MTKQEVDYLILGQGLAGTLLSYRMLRAGLDHRVIDRGHQLASSNVAAGIVNPVTGRRFVKTWKIEGLLNSLSVYEELARLLDVKLLNEITVYRDLSEVSALNQWDMRRSDDAYSPYMDKPQMNLKLAVKVPEIVGPTLQAVQINLRELISSYRAFLVKKGWLIASDVNIDDAERINEGWRLGGFTARNIIDCTGAAARLSTTWGKLPWRGTKGEVFRFSLGEMPRNMAIKMSYFICPVGLKDEVWLGATNQDHFVHETPSQEGKKRLEEQAAAFEISIPKNHEHASAVRPTVKDRRPLVGEHPDRLGLWICNGFGTKGTSLGPFCTESLLDKILHNRPLDSEIDIANRFTA